MEDCPTEVLPTITLISLNGGHDGSSTFPFNFSSKKIPQISLPDVILNLLLQVIAFVRVVYVISMEAAILVLIALVRISFHLLWPLQGWIVLDLHKHLIKRNIQGCVMQISF